MTTYEITLTFTETRIDESGDPFYKLETVTKLDGHYTSNQPVLGILGLEFGEFSSKNAIAHKCAVENAVWRFNAHEHRASDHKKATVNTVVVR